MSVIKKGLCLLMVAALAATGSLNAAEPFHPFAESMDFNPDWQIFAPVEVQDLEEMHPRKRANHGWYVTYDRLHIGFDRPEIATQSSKIDMTWGNRWDAGYMGEQNKGWLFSYTSVSGPNVYDDARYLRLQQPTTTGTGGGATTPAERFLTFRPRVLFDPEFGDGTQLVRQSENVATLTSVEFNRTWRLSPYHYGGVLEPLVGFRYIGFNDYARNENYRLLDIDADGTYDAEQFQQQTTRTDNRMALAQLGFRFTQPVRRFTFSQDSRFFAGQNFQTQGYSNYIQTFTDDSGNVGIGSPFEPFRAFSGRDNSEFVVGMDLRFEAAYQVTKAFNFRLGSQFLYIGRGVWRGSNPGFGPQEEQNQNVISPAFTFGFAFNR